MTIYETGLTHKIGKVVIATGIGGELYFVFAEKPNGSFKRISPSIGGEKSPETVIEQLREYLRINSRGVVSGYYEL